MADFELRILSPTELKVNGGTHIRLKTSESHVRELARKIGKGVTLDPLVACFDGTTYWLADGFHRLKAYQKLKRPTVEVHVYPGGKNEAILKAVEAHLKEPKNLNLHDKRNACRMVLMIDPNVSSRSIADRCGWRHQFVEDRRRELVNQGLIPACPSRVDKRGARRPATANKPSTLSKRVSAADPDGELAEQYRNIVEQFTVLAARFAGSLTDCSNMTSVLREGGILDDEDVETYSHLRTHGILALDGWPTDMFEKDKTKPEASEITIEAVEDLEEFLIAELLECASRFVVSSRLMLRARKAESNGKQLSQKDKELFDILREHGEDVLNRRWNECLGPMFRLPRAG